MTYVTNKPLYFKSMGLYGCGALLIFIAAYFVLIFLSIPISRAFYNYISKKPIKISELFKFSCKNFSRGIIVTAIILVELSLLVIIDIALGAIISLIIIFILVFLGFGPIAGTIVMYVMYYIITFIASFQYLLFGIKIIILAFDECSVKETINKFIDLYKFKSVNYIIMSLLLTIIWMCLFMFLNLPVLLYQYYAQLVLGYGITENISALELVLFNLWNFGVSTLVWPYVIIALCNYYFHYKSEKEGFDLQLQIKA